MRSGVVLVLVVAAIYVGVTTLIVKEALDGNPYAVIPMNGTPEIFWKPAFLLLGVT